MKIYIIDTKDNTIRISETNKFMCNNSLTLYQKKTEKKDILLHYTI